MTRFGAVCRPDSTDNTKELFNFFGFPSWWKYLKLEPDAIDPTKCVPKIDKLGDIWAIALAVIEILIRVGGLVAVGFVIYGAFQYMTSQGEPDRTAAAKNTVQNGIIGLIIVIIAIGVVTTIGNKLI